MNMKFTTKIRYSERIFYAENRFEQLPAVLKMS